MGGGPTEPTTYELYHDEQSGFSLSYPSEWNKYDWRGLEEITGQEPDPEMEESIEQGKLAVIAFRDASESGAFFVMMMDFEKMGEPVMEMDEMTCNMIAVSVAGQLEDFHLDSTEKITMGKKSDGSKQEAWEIIFGGKSKGTKQLCNTLIMQSESKLYIAMFMCTESTYVTLKPAYDKLKETFQIH